MKFSKLIIKKINLNKIYMYGTGIRNDKYVHVFRVELTHEMFLKSACSWNKGELVSEKDQDQEKEGSFTTEVSD